MSRRPEPIQWPATGFWCAICGGPLHPSIIAEGHTTHPTCAPEAVKA